MTLKLGPYLLKQQIGQGGMGQVFCAFDSVNKRDVAVKIIKPNLLKNPISKKRFLQEAYINAKLSHPAILPIHSIEIHEEAIGYSMPLLEGETLKQMLMRLRKDSSIMPLKERLKHFMKILEACEYTHKMGYIHRDIKADNIFIGSFHQTFLFDWGLACPMDQIDFDDEDSQEPIELTRPGKIPGTLTHLAPERAFGVKASIQTDIFSLGVVLYQLLTLKMPFNRKDLDHFKHVAGKETFTIPSEANIYEDIDEGLNLIAARALENDASKRYSSVSFFIEDLQKILDGLPIWKEASTLNFHRSSDWMFQDLLPLGDYIALSQKSLSWGILSVPKLTLLDNFRCCFEAKVFPQGFKIYLNLAKHDSRFDLETAYILELDPLCGLRLYRYYALIEEKKEQFELSADVLIEIEKIENHFKIFLNHKFVFSFHSRLPNLSPYIGFIFEDQEFSNAKVKILQAASVKQVSCLKLGDTLVSHELMPQARLEYQRIYESFKEHEEGREALFRKGYSFILEAKIKKQKTKSLLNQAINVFETFRHEKPKPWEYWGKALCYEMLCEPKEMIKCFELAFRKYPDHFFSTDLKTELLVLFFKKSIRAKKEALMLAFIALRYLDDRLFFEAYPDLIDSIIEELHPCFCLLNTQELSKKKALILALSFILREETYLAEAISKSDDPLFIENALCILVHLNSKLLKPILWKNKELNPDFRGILEFQEPLLSYKHLRLVQLAYHLYKKPFTSPPHIKDSKEAFIFAIHQILNHKEIKNLNMDQYDEAVIEIFENKKNLSTEEIKKKFKSSFFQESDHFIRSNYIIGLIEKNMIDYFGYDKYILEFAIKALFLRQS